mgnify:CR=1 FL=1
MKTVLLAALLLTAPIKAQEYRELPAELPPSRYGVIGVRLEAIDSDSVAIAKVRLHSPAHRAGFRPRDVIISIDGVAVSSHADFRKTTENYDGSRGMLVAVKRDGFRRFVVIKDSD